jgi:oxamate amidohydrolase
MLLRNADLAAVLRGIGRNGFNGFYRGDVATQIVAAIHKRGGFISPLDMATHHSDWVEVPAVPYRDVIAYELPPPTQGLTALAMLARLNRLRASQMSAGPEFVATFRSIRDACYALRDRYITDPNFTPAPLEAFLDPETVAVGDTSGPDAGDTVYLCAADEHGNLVSLIQSVAYDFGSGIVAEGTGILLQNRGCYFKLDPAHVNRLEPKKRTMHTLIPAMATRNGRPWAIFGTMGGDGQPQLQTQVLINLVDHGLDPQDAVSRPRFRVRAGGRTVGVEATYPSAAEMSRTMPDVELIPPRHHSLGHAHAIVIDGPGQWRAGADPRSDGAAITVG